MVTRQLPPLNALRAFEAAARHLSFTKAADELNVTPAAISHQIKGLEAYVGVPLFRRLTRALMLTDAGQAALPSMRDGFDRLATAVDRMKAHETSGGLTVSVAPSLAAKWLVPRLDNFHMTHPEFDIRIDANEGVVDLARENIDIGIRYGSGRYPGLRVDRLFTEIAFPVCSPDLMRGPKPLREPADLAHHTLLHVDWVILEETWPNWRMWLLAAGADGVDSTRGPRFSAGSLAVQAAVDGHGVMLGSSVLAAGDLAAGRLVRPFDLSLPVAFSWYVVSLEAKADQPKIAAFRRWILAEAQPNEEVSPGAPAAAGSVS